MITFFKTTPEGVTTKIDAVEPGCWVSVVKPTSDDRVWLQDEVGVVSEFIRSALDEEESPHVDFDDDTGQTMIIMDCAAIEEADEVVDDTIVQYDTQPLSFLIVPDRELFITLSIHDNATVTHFSEKALGRINTRYRTNLFLQMALHISQRYLACLRNIHRQFTKNEKELHRSMRNEELIKMLGFDKSLVYFSTSLKADESVLKRVSAGTVLKLYEEDRDVLDDVMIELGQANEMCSIYSTILNGTMETFGSVISNNLNLTMRTLTALALVLAIPTIIFSFYGMNVANLPAAESWLVPVVVSIIACIIAGVVIAVYPYFMRKR